MRELLRHYFDEHIDDTLVEPLQARGIDVLTTLAAGHANQEVPDEKQLAFATALGRVLVTQDRDFVVLSSTHIPHTGIILLQKPLAIGQYIEYLELMAKTTEADEMHDRLIYCDW